ncbi:hypothetical protein HDU84_004730 [Entophlyctis sp. JEL0112]|nr:hypothetical protein HDU84_004730 [Entophlyctis sp. JEL0112]
MAPDSDVQPRNRAYAEKGSSRRVASSLWCGTLGGAAGQKTVGATKFPAAATTAAAKHTTKKKTKKMPITTDPGQDAFVGRLLTKTGDARAHKEAVQEYMQSFDLDKRNLADTARAEALRREQSQKMTNHFYNMVTDFYEYGWGQSFHFARMYKDSPFAVNIARHEGYLAVRLGLEPGMTVLDVGCGVGGPMREIAKVSDATVVGLNNNEYQVARTKILNERAGLSARTDVRHGDFCSMPFKDASFDAVYQVEATCHAPRLEMVYGEIFRVLKPGGKFASYEWCTTEKYNEADLEMKRVVHLVEEGNSISKFYTIPQCIQALKSVGFEIIETRDLAEDDYHNPAMTPWYDPLESVFARTRIGRILTDVFVRVLETVGLAPAGTTKVQNLLSSAGDNLERAGKLGVFTPMFFCLVRKPLK